MTEEVLLILTEKEIAPSQCHYGCPVALLKLRKLSGRMTTKRFIHAVLSTPANQLIHIQAEGWRYPSDTHHGRAIPLASEKAEMFYCFSLSEDKAKSC